MSYIYTVHVTPCDYRRPHGFYPKKMREGLLKTHKKKDIFCVRLSLGFEDSAEKYSDYYCGGMVTNMAVKEWLDQNCSPQDYYGFESGFYAPHEYVALFTLHFDQKPYFPFLL